MSDSNILWVNTKLQGEEVAEFRRLQEALGIRTNTDVVRHLIRQEAIERGIACPQPVLETPQ